MLCIPLVEVANPMGGLPLSASLVELVSGGVNNDALHATNGSQQSDDDSTKDAEPGCPKVPAAGSRFLDGQPEHGGKAVGGGTKP